MLELPLFTGNEKSQRRELASYALARWARGKDVSQTQRNVRRAAAGVAIARHSSPPPIIMADEPTGNLDSKSVARGIKF
jgi:ABC-type lipoprotein export system ATPase subunit